MVSNNIKQKSKGPPFRSGNEWFWSGKDVIQILTLPESNKATENGWLEYHLFAGAMLVSESAPPSIMF